MVFHEHKHDFECSCCEWGWPREDRFRDNRGVFIRPPLCLKCAEHSEATGKENALKRHLDHDDESRCRYEIAKQERDQMLAHNGQQRVKLEQARIDQDKAIGFLDDATARHWPKGPGEGCCCGEEHCATSNVGATAWVSERIQKRRALKRLAS
jgi:hypothetical protein